MSSSATVPFSYAQAAKGRPASQVSAPQSVSSQSPSVASSQSHMMNAGGTNSPLSASLSTVSNDMDVCEITPRQIPGTENGSGMMKPTAAQTASETYSPAPLDNNTEKMDAKSNSSEATTVQPTSNSSNGNESSKKSAAPATTTPHPQSHSQSDSRATSTDQRSKGANSSNRTPDSDARRGKKGKRGKESKDVKGSNSATSNGNGNVATKDKDKDNDSNEASNKSDKGDKARETEPPAQLIDSPIPTVNFWEQRKKSRETKSKTQPPALAPVPTACPVPTSSTTKDSTKDLSATVATTAEHPIPSTTTATSATAATAATSTTNTTTPIKPLSSSSAAAATDSQEVATDIISPGFGRGHASSTPKGLNNNKAKDVGQDSATPRRNVPKGSKAAGDKDRDKDETASTTAAGLPPSVDDASAWPTPLTSATEVKKGEKDETASEPTTTATNTTQDTGSRRGKNTWKTMEIAPSPAVFQTPIPNIRGGRGGRAGAHRGGRENGTRTTGTLSASGDKSQSSVNTSMANNNHHNNNNSTLRNASQPSNPSSSSSKRSQVDSSSNSRESRKTASGLSPDTSKPHGGNPSNIGGKAQDHSANGNGATSIGQSGIMNGGSTTATTAATTTAAATTAAAAAAANHLPKGSNQFLAESTSKEAGAGPVHSPLHSGGREGAPRNRRGRGGFSAANGQNQPHSQSPFYGGNAQPGMPPNMHNRQSVYPNGAGFPPGAFPGPYQSQGHPGAQRQSNRSNSTTGHPYGRGQANGRGNRGPALTTNFPYEQPLPHNGPYSAPLAPVPHVTLVDLVRSQIDFYFSFDNLIRDIFLRSHMDSQGFVFIDFVAGFHRMKKLTDDRGLVRLACEQSNCVEIVIGDDGLERLRPVTDATRWVFPKEKRTDSARDDEGPASFTVSRPPNFPAYPPAPAMMPVFNYEQPMLSPPPVGPSLFPTYVNGVPAYGHDLVNGHAMANGANGHRTQNGVGDTQLSATVPEFTPPQYGQTKDPAASFAVNGHNAVPLLNGNHVGSSGIVTQPDMTAMNTNVPQYASDANTTAVQQGSESH